MSHYADRAMIQRCKGRRWVERKPHTVLEMVMSDITCRVPDPVCSLMNLDVHVVTLDNRRLIYVGPMFRRKSSEIGG